MCLTNNDDSEQDLQVAYPFISVWSYNTAFFNVNNLEVKKMCAFTMTTWHWKWEDKIKNIKNKSYLCR